MDSIHAAAVGPKRKRRWCQFRVRTMLLAVIPLALGSVWLADVLRRDDTVHLAVTEDGVLLSSGQTLPLGPAASVYPLKDDLRQQIGHRASGRPGATLTARITVDPEAPCGKVKRAVWACQQLGIGHFEFRSAGEQMRLHMLPPFCRGTPHDAPPPAWVRHERGSERLVWRSGDDAFVIDVPPLPRCTGVPDEGYPPIWVRLASDREGSLVSIRLRERELRDLPSLNRHISDIVSDTVTGSGVAFTHAVLLDCADALKFKRALDAYVAVSRRSLHDGSVVPLIENVWLLPVLDSEYDE